MRRLCVLYRAAEGACQAGCWKGCAEWCREQTSRAVAAVSAKGRKPEGPSHGSVVSSDPLDSQAPNVSRWREKGQLLPPWSQALSYHATRMIISICWIIAKYTSSPYYSSPAPSCVFPCPCGCYKRAFSSPVPVCTACFPSCVLTIGRGVCLLHGTVSHHKNEA